MHPWYLVSLGLFGVPMDILGLSTSFLGLSLKVENSPFGGDVPRSLGFLLLSQTEATYTLGLQRSCAVNEVDPLD